MGHWDWLKCNNIGKIIAIFNQFLDVTYDRWWDMICYMIWYMICMIYILLTAIRLTPSGSSAVHIYTQTVHTAQWKSIHRTYITIKCIIYKIKQKHTKHTNIYIYIYIQRQNGTKTLWKNVMNEKAIYKLVATFIWTLYLLIMVDT
jgi:hypothetical protein